MVFLLPIWYHNPIRKGSDTMSIRQTMELYFTGERLITPSGLSSVGNMLSKSEFVR